MIVDYSSNNYMFDLGHSEANIRKNEMGFYIDTFKAPKYFNNFIFTTHNNTYYLITSSKNEFVVYIITDKVEQAIVLYNSNKIEFEYIILKIGDEFIKVTKALKIENLSKDAITKSNCRYPSKCHLSIEQCELTVLCNIPILYSIKANVFYPYEGNVVTEFFFQ